MDIRGLHDIATMTGVMGMDARPLPGTRLQALAQLLQLEAERPRLERDIQLLSEKQQRARSRQRCAQRRTRMLMGMVNRPEFTGRRRLRKSALSGLAPPRSSAGNRAEQTQAEHNGTMEY